MRNSPHSAVAALRDNGALRLAMLLCTLALAIGCSRNQDTAWATVDANAVKMMVEQEGFYRVTLRELEESGLKLGTLSAGRIELSQDGRMVPFLVEGNDLIFHGRAPDDPYARARAYVLRAGESGHALGERSMADTAVQQESEIRDTVHLEENMLYVAESGLDEGEDPWFWQTVGQGQRLPLKMTLPGVVDGSATLRLRLWGTTHNQLVENDHDLDLILNDRPLGTIRWDGQIAHIGELELPPGTLKSGDNELILDNQTSGASALDIMALDWIELEFAAAPAVVDDLAEFTGDHGLVTLTGFTGRPLVFAFEADGTPVRLTGWEYGDGRVRLKISDRMRIVAVGPEGFRSAPRIDTIHETDWHNRDNRAELLILTTSTLAPALEPLAEARSNEGIPAVIVPVQEIYDEFGFGAETPASIQKFVSYAYGHWQTPQPNYLLLVGDATSDYRNYLGKAPRNHIPSPMVPVAYGGQTVSDSRLADVDGDMKPDLAVGRWPVDSIESVKNLVRRTLAYEHGASSDRALFAADGTETQFAETALRLIEQGGFDGDTLDLVVGASADEISERINQGTWLTAYVGHGSVEQWGKEGVYHPGAVGDLRPATPPIVLQFTCLTGLFAHPELTSLSEAMLNHERGPVLLIAATSLTLSVHQEALAYPLLQNLQDPDKLRIGDAFLESQRSLDVENPGLREIVDTYVLLGDPSARILRPET